MNDLSPHPRLKFFPVSFFAMVMGLAGLAIAWQKAEGVYGLRVHISSALLVLAGLAFAGLTLLYLSKLLRYHEAVANELGHPTQLNFFPTISISLILFSIATLGQWPGPAGVLWVLGTALLSPPSAGCC